MEMSLNRISSALFPWFLWLSLLPSPVAATTDSTPSSSFSSTSSSSPPSSAAASHAAANATLLFESSAPGNSLRNCSCSTRIPHCDEALANLLCSCHTVQRAALPPAGLTEVGGVTVWLREPWVLQDLLNRSVVGHLRLAFCGGDPLQSQYLALVGLRTLTIHSAAPGIPFPNQEITIATPEGGAVAEKGTHALHSSSSSSSPSSSSSSSSSTPLQVTVLDVAVLNGLSALKAYSVAELTVSMLPLQFPNLPLSLLLPSPPPSSPPPDGATGSRDQEPEPERKLALTFVY